MIDLFFDEATERVEGVSQKLLAIERAAGDAELLRDLFRDLHTVKGSSAMVGLEPVNRLAHAAEDLVGQLRDGTPPSTARSSTRCSPRSTPCAPCSTKPGRARPRSTRRACSSAAQPGRGARSPRALLINPRPSR
ncbi:MAG: Hpt domain-containing protein [Polyangiaceae bacterium]